MSEIDEFEYDVFVSYSHKNSDWVNKILLPRLKKNGLKICIDERDFQPGSPSVKEMERAISTSRKIIAVLTPEYLASSWTDFELKMTQTLSPANQSKRLIPVLLAKCELPLSIGYLNYVDFAQSRSKKIQWKRLLDAVKRPFRIMLVDDEYDVRTTIGGLLEDNGYSVILAANESEASILQKNKELDCLVVDIGLQGGSDNYDESGFRLAQDFRQRNPALYIVVLTGRGIALSGKGAKQLIIRAFRDIGVNDFIEKDPDMGTRLLASIQKLLNNKN